MFLCVIAYLMRCNFQHYKYLECYGSEVMAMLRFNDPLAARVARYAADMFVNQSAASSTKFCIQMRRGDFSQLG